MTMQVNKPKDKKTFFNKQLKVEKGKVRASRCIYYSDALCFLPEKRYKLCDECPKMNKGKDRDSEGLFKKIVGNAIHLMDRPSPPPPTRDLKL